MRSFVYGTGNPAKLAHMRDMLRGVPVCILSPGEAGLALPDVEETGNDPLENARLKARACHAAWNRAVFSCDSGLYLQGIEDRDQPGVRVRTVGGRRLNDEEMLEHYSALALRCGGVVRAQYQHAICLIDRDGRVFEACDDSLRSEPFGLCAVPHAHRVPGFPLDALSVELATGKYYYDLESPLQAEEHNPVTPGFRAFFERIGGIQLR